jgi:hypothetical protein
MQGQFSLCEREREREREREQGMGRLEWGPLPIQIHIQLNTLLQHSRKFKGGLLHMVALFGQKLLHRCFTYLPFFSTVTKT